MDPQNGMFPQPSQSSSKLVFWLVAMLAIVIIGGVIWWSWPRDPGIPVAEVAPKVTTDVVQTAPTTIATALNDLDSALSSIENDLASTNDAEPTL